LIEAVGLQGDTALPTSLPSPYNTPPSTEAIEPSVPTLNLVETQVNALLTASPSYHSLSDEDQTKLSENLTKIAAYSAELIRDDWYQSEKIGQRPIVRKKEIIEPVSQSQATTDDGFNSSAANQIGRVTKETLNAIAFPTFVADLIKGTFNAIVQSSIQQMEAYLKLIENVSKTVDQFMESNISDNQAKDWLVSSYPDYLEIKKDSTDISVKKGADDKKLPNFQTDLNLSSNVGLDESEIEETLVPAARRKLAQSRHQMLSTMVLMGINRIVVTGGKIRATMGFHIDTSDVLHQEKATDFDFRAAAAGSFGFGPWSVSASTSVSYVTSNRQTNDSQINVEADLTGEVEIHFKSDYFPLERFANSGSIRQIQGNTAVPDANSPSGNSVSQSSPFSEPPKVGGGYETFKSSQTKRKEIPKPKYSEIGTPLPPAKMPEKPMNPDDIHKVNKVEEKKEETKVENEVKPESEVKKTEATEPKKEETSEPKKEETPSNESTAEKPVENKEAEKPKESGETDNKSAESSENKEEKKETIGDKAKQAVSEVGGQVKGIVADKAGDFVKGLIGNIGK
jgi:hypothetical protein